MSKENYDKDRMIPRNIACAIESLNGKTFASMGRLYGVTGQTISAATYRMLRRAQRESAIFLEPENKGKIGSKYPLLSKMALIEMAEYRGIKKEVDGHLANIGSWFDSGVTK